MQYVPEICEQDFTYGSAFELIYRFTDSRHTVLSPTELKEIQPVSELKAKEVSDYVLSFYDEKGQLNETLVQEIIGMDVTQDKVDAGEWLRNLLPNADSIIISWDTKNCVVTNTDIFCQYWDAFCYPSSDDVTIFSMSSNWIMSYAHYERFEFGHILKVERLRSKDYE